MISTLPTHSLVMALLGLAIAAGQAQSEPVPAADVPLKDLVRFENIVPFVRDDWTPRLYGGGVEEHTHDETILFGTLAFERQLREDVTCVWELVGYNVNSRESVGHNSGGFGVNIGLRKQLCRIESIDADTYFETLVGLAYFDRRTPYLGTHFNFTYSFSLGLEKKTSEQSSMILGARYFHLSNANKDGDERNPSIDAIGGFAGLTIRF